MREVAMLQGADPKQILQIAVEKKVPAVMTYLSKGKWHVAKVFLAALSSDKLNVECIHSEEKPQPISIRIHQPVGISLKYGYGKFVFDTTVVDLESAPDKGGTISLAIPDHIEVIQRRSYFRVSVPESLKVNALLWHRNRDEAEGTIKDSSSLREGAGRRGKFEPQGFFHGRLMDISAGGAQVVIPNQAEVSPDFKKGCFVGVRFTPMPYETPLLFNAQIRNVLLVEEDKSVYLGLQIIGLEVSPEGRKVLSRIVGVVERYFKLNRSSAKQQDMQRASAVP
jgi:c-di-GMP-binding flagellar brake protein YcgR